MIIEFAGLPGSGKSTIANRLAAETAISTRIPAKSWRVLAYHPVLLLRESARWSSIGRGTGWPAWVALWVRSMTQRALAERSTQLELFEEGITHHLWRQIIRHPALETAPWQAIVALQQPLIVLDLDRATRYRRIASKREKGRINRQLEAAGPDSMMWDHAERLFERIVREAAAHREVIRISTDGSEDEVVKRVREAIAALR